MIRRRVHVGCGTENPFRPLLLWTLYAVALLIMWPLILFVHTWWAFGAWLPWVLAIAASIRWEIIHSPRKMYRTWRP